TVLDANSISDALQCSSASAAVTHDAAGFDVEGHVADGEACLIAEVLGQAQKRADVGEIRDEANRHPNRPGALAAAVLHELPKTRKGHVVAGCGRGEHVVGGEPLGHFTGAGVAEAPRSKGYLALVGQLLDTTVIDQVAVRIVEVHRQCATPHGHGGWPVDAN